MSATSFARRVETVSLGLAIAALAGGGVMHLAGDRDTALVIWICGTALGVGLSAWWVADAALHRRLGVDLIALTALIGTLVVGEFLAGALITVMLVSGRSLEGWAAGRAERELRALLHSGPQVAHRYQGGVLSDPALAEVAVGDLLLVQPGEVVPVDGTVRTGPAVIDESALTGESMPIECAVGDAVRGGALNAGGPFDLLATTGADDSTYAGIVRMVKEASAVSSPLVRMADRFATMFLAATFAVAGGAWLAAGELSRAVAVLVVATPCPLILAAPVAIVAGLSRAAKRGVVIKGGAALEALADADILLFDKTGTLTSGRPSLAEIISADGGGNTEVLRLAASLDQVSPHVLASAIVRAGRDRHLELVMPTDTVEQAGSGVRGTVDGRKVAVGKGSWAGVTGAEPWVVHARERSELEGALTVFVGIDGVAAGALVLRDPIRHDAARTVRQLRRSGIRRVVMVTGDRTEVAESVGALIGVDHIESEQTPAGKVSVIRREAETGQTIMVGDGINDAPALALAGVGVAIGARGATASSEAADVVLTVDRLDRLGEARLIAQRSRHIATQSVIAGMALSLIAMVVAAAGYLPAAWGALLQEVIDVAVILNALRALTPGQEEARLDDYGSQLARRFSTEHLSLRPNLVLLLNAADHLGDTDDPDPMIMVRQAQRLMVNEIEPHERDEEQHLYPAVSHVLGGTDPTVTMSRTHAEISRFTTHLGLVIKRVGQEPPGPADRRELQRLLYGLYAVLELHFAQEDENYLSLAEDSVQSGVL